MLIDADFCGAHPCPLGVHFCILQFWGTFWIGLDQPLFTFLEALRRDPAHLSDCLPMHPNSLQPHNITIYTNTQIQTQIQKHKYTNTNTQIQIHKYKARSSVCPTSTHSPRFGRPDNITCIANHILQYIPL